MDYTDNYIGTMLDDRYEILEKIGSGGMAVVYKARCHRLNRLVAVKILRPDFAQNDDLRRRFHAESQAVAMMQNPNIVSVYDVGTTNGVDYIVMELIEGITLKQYISRKGELSWREALHFSTQIAKALSHAHSRKIIHRDIKPHNIMVLRDGSVKVADFGIACLLSTQNTLTQQALGSVHYISPEQAQGGHVDERTDIYSLGVVMYEMLTGTVPFEGDSPVSIALKHISSTPKMPREINPDIPEALERIVMKAMEPNLKLRYASVDKLLSDIEEFRKNPYATPEEAAESVGREKRRREKNTKQKKDAGDSGKYNKLTTVIIVISLVLVLAAIGFFMWKTVLKDLMAPSDVKVSVDNFVGQNVKDVQRSSAYVARYNFTIMTIDSEYPEGYIISQDPLPQQQISINTKNEKTKIEVHLTVSDGEEPVYMPDLLNKDYREAKYELDSLGLGLKIELKSAPSEDVEPNRVVDQFPDEGTELNKNASVFITYSTGPEIAFVDVPTVTGLSESKAKLRLDSYDLTYSLQYVFDEAEKGEVVFQSYEPGVSVPIGTEVVLQISKGPEIVTPPDPPIDDPVIDPPDDPGVVDPPVEPEEPSEERHD